MDYRYTTDIFGRDGKYGYVSPSPSGGLMDSNTGKPRFGV